MLRRMETRFVGAGTSSSSHAAAAAAQDACKVWDINSEQQPDFGKDQGGSGLGQMESYKNCVVAEYVWVDNNNVTRSKTKTLSRMPVCVEDLPMWNYDGSSTGQAAGEDSEIYIIPRALFRDPFRRGNNVMVMAECFTPQMKPAIGNHRAKCAEIMELYKDHDPWFGIEQEYTLMAPAGVGEVSSVPKGFNKDGSDPAPQGSYYCAAGCGLGIGREIVEEHYARCIFAGVKIAGVNAEVMPGQWEFQIGPCRGIEMGDHLHIARYILNRVAEGYNTQISFAPKPRPGDWNGAGCHTNFSTAGMRAAGGMEVIKKVCQHFATTVQEHIDAYGEGNEQRLTGEHETCSINEYKFGVADRGASIRIPRETDANGKGYMEDRRPAANCDPYKVTYVMMKSTGAALK